MFPWHGSIPSACEDDCKAAFAQVQQSNNRTAACDPDSPITIAFNECKSCVAEQSANSTDADTWPGGFFGFCSSAAPTAPYTSTTTFTIVSTESDGSLAKLVYTSTTTITPSTSSESTATSSSPTSSSTAPIGELAHDTESPRSSAWIAGPVVGSIVGLGIVLLALAIYMKRQRRKPADPASPGETSKSDMYMEEGWTPGDKPQLHSDDIKPSPVHELDSSSRQRCELAAREPIGVELQGDTQVHEMPS